jgi:hypothetical protein
MAMVKANFTIDDMETFEGWHDPHVRWNGFACPFFERAAADRVAQAFGLRYVEPCDAYVDETDAYAGMQRDSLHLYAIGAQGWTWCEAGDLERDS